MYKSCLIIATLILTLTTYGQNSDTSAKVKNPLTTYQRDSLILSIQYGTSKIVEKVTGPESAIGRYKVYRTTNIYNSLKLDTATGKVTALQIGINDDKSRFEYLVCDKVEIYLDLQIIGRYELYPTGNNYNFILLDTLFGWAYQVQWSTANNQCGIWRIW